ncbi:holin [uncultured Jatrophihabitans sp.]|uniref:holin n=1 Tax=uncultured Jatrophihabitans sp. TaxID=1610747 RepID=UPI0035CC1EEC
MTVKAFWTDLGERVVSTFLQVFLATLLATQSVATGFGHSRADWVNATMVALLAAFAALLTTLLLWLTSRKPIANPLVDLAYRAVVTFGQTLAGYVAAAGLVSALTFDWDTALVASASAAGTALLKGLIGATSRDTSGAAAFTPPAESVVEAQHVAPITEPIRDSELAPSS